ncbi:MAG: DUF4337 domain-containing protein [Terriglobales bacterium]
MSSEELHELQEHAEHAKHDPSLAPVSVTMAILAVLVAIVSLLGHRAATEAVLNQAKASDQWGYYQAKNIRGHEDRLFANLTAVVPSSNAEALAKIREEYLQEAERYKDDQKEIEGEARKLEQEVALEQRRANRYDLGEVFLEIALVITSITLLSRRRVFWQLGLLMGAVGLGLAATGFLVR